MYLCIEYTVSAGIQFFFIHRMRKVLTIRKAQQRDIDALAETDRAIFGEGWTSRMFDDELTADGAYLTVAEDSGAIVAYASVRIGADAAELFKIAVIPAYRRAGIAQMLYNDAEAFCRSQRAPSVLLEVREDNAAAISFYRKNGFTQTGLRKRYYGDCSAVLMEKAL